MNDINQTTATVLLSKLANIIGYEVDGGGYPVKIFNLVASLFTYLLHTGSDPKISDTEQGIAMTFVLAPKHRGMSEEQFLLAFEDAYRSSIDLANLAIENECADLSAIEKEHIKKITNGASYFEGKTRPEKAKKSREDVSIVGFGPRVEFCQKDQLKTFKVRIAGEGARDIKAEVADDACSSVNKAIFVSNSMNKNLCNQTTLNAECEVVRDEFMRIISITIFAIW